MVKGYGGWQGGGMIDLMSVMKMFGKGGFGKGKGKGGKDNSATIQKLKKIEADHKVWVGGIAKGVTWKDLEKHFESNATKPSISEVMPNGTGVCAFKNAEDATAAIATVNGTELKGKTLEVDVWTKMEKTDGAGNGGKWKLVERLKEVQRGNADAKEKWWALCDESHGGVHDPKKHKKEVLEEFLAAYPETEKTAGGGDKWKLVTKVKELQRSDAAAKEKWWAFTDEKHGGIHDPKRHDKAVLEEFLAGYA
jgi:hypothetical protein